MKGSCSEPVSTRRSSVLIFPLQQGFPGLVNLLLHRMPQNVFYEAKEISIRRRRRWERVWSFKMVDKVAAEKGMVDEMPLAL